MVRLQIVMQRGDITLTLTLLDTTLIMYDGDAPIEQQFDSVAALVEHVQRVVKLRQNAGYRVVAERSGNDIVMPPDPTATREGEEWDAARKRLSETFDEAAEPARESAAIVARVTELGAKFLRLVPQQAGPGDAWSEALAGHPVSSLTSFVFDAPAQTVVPHGAQSCGPIDQLLAGLPSLQRLYLCGELRSRPLRHPTLRELVLVGDPLSDDLLAALGKSALPALESLSLELASDAEPASAERVTAAVLGIKAAQLARVHLERVDDLAAVLDRLASAGRTWQELWLAGTIRDEHGFLEVIRRHAAWLATIPAVGLPLADELSSDAVRACEALVPTLVDSDDAPDASNYDAW